MTGRDLAYSPLLYILIGVGLIAIIVFAAYSFVKTRKRCLEIGITQETINSVIKSTFIAALVPSSAVLLGFIVLASSLGVAWPWWRLSVIGSLSYETMAAQFTANGIGVQLSSVLDGDASIFAAIMIVMTIGVVIEPLAVAIIGKKYSTSIMVSKSGSKGDWGIILSGVFFLIMFAVYIPVLIFSALPNAMTMVTALCVTFILNKVAKVVPVVKEFTMAIAMICGMASSLLWVSLFA